MSSALSQVPNPRSRNKRTFQSLFTSLTHVFFLSVSFCNFKQKRDEDSFFVNIETNFEGIFKILPVEIFSYYRLSYTTRLMKRETILLSERREKGKRKYREAFEIEFRRPLSTYSISRIIIKDYDQCKTRERAR